MATEQYLEIRKYISDNITKVYPELKLYNNLPFYEDVPIMIEQSQTTKRNLIVGLDDYDYYNSKIISRGFVCSIELNEIEEVLIPLLKKYFSLNPSVIPSISFKKDTDANYDEVWDSFKKYRDIDLVTTPEVLDALCDHYIEVIGKHFIPFWEKYSDLQYINDEIIDKVDQMQISNYFGVGLVQFKKLIIMKLCNNKNYQNYLDWLLGLYKSKEEAMKDDDAWQAKYNLFKELIQILENKASISKVVCKLKTTDLCLV